jgi:hypothetical protein
MKRLFLFAHILLLFPAFLYAQTTLKKAVVINISGDSIHGFIKDMGWMENPDKFLFTKSIDTLNKVIVNEGNANQVIIEDVDFYRKFTLPISMDDVHTTLLNNKPDTSKVIKTVFLKVLVEGCNSNLYSYTDGIKTRFFFTDQNIFTPRELRYRTYYTDDKLSIITDKSYIKQLEYLSNLYASGSNELKNKVRSAPYARDELIEIFSIINGGKNSIICPINIVKNKTKLQFFVDGGFRRSTLKGMDYANCHKLTSNAKRSPSSSFYFGVGLNIKSNPGARLFIQEALKFSGDKLVSSDYYEEPQNYFSEDYSYTITQRNFTLSNVLVYNIINLNNAKLYFGLGIDVNYSKISKSKYTTHIYGKYTNEYLNKEPLLEPTRIWIAFPLKMGIIIKDRINLNISYYLPVSQNNDTQFNIWEVGMAINLNK